MEFLAGPEVLVLLFAVALVAGCIDAIAGGGGLLTLPVLLWAGLPPAAALATNKLQGTFGTLVASVTFIRRGEIDLARFWPFIAGTFAGSAVGTIGVRMVDASALERMIPVLLVGVALYVLLSPRAGDIEAHRRVPDAVFIGAVAPLIGAYDGFFGPGTGSFFAIGFVALLGHSLRRATAHAKVLNFTSNIASLAIFVAGGHVVWIVGGAMALGQLIGARVGAHLVVRVGARIVRPVLVVVSVVLALKLLIWG
ncbi:TSUP family transporter [Zavarzinia compransoris]|uniref:TSUP family transporter n=1 Tax=Zavarzinia marina TaxID=2911065 RepID=UPI001F212E45|nr:TSUP family transporter [Zavarzinia marina]MCF4165516.1 TSUP family transporter [Zavarzinia marina]